MTDPSPEVPAEPPLVSPPVGFRGVPWQPIDLVVGLSVVLAAWMVQLLRPPWLEELPALVRQSLAIGLMGWLLGFPFWAARRRCPGFTVRLPAVRRLLQEALLAPLLFPILWAVLIALLVLWSRVSPEPPRHPVMEAVSESRPTPALFALVMAAFTLVPVVEEVFFRGFLYNALRRRLPLRAALVGQAFVFGLLHSYSIGYIIMASAIGLVLGIVYEWRRTLFAPIFLHALQNFVPSVIVVLAMLANAATPRLGVVVDPAAADCRVAQVQPGSPAEQLGIQPGDIITALDGTPIVKIQDLRQELRKRKPGDELTVEYSRDGTTHKGVVRLPDEP